MGPKSERGRAERHEGDRPLRRTTDEPDVIVVAIDASSSSTRIVNVATAISRSLPEAALHLVHVLKVSRIDHAHSGAPTRPTNDEIAKANEHLAEHVKLARNQCRNVIAGHMVVGDPTSEILRMCKDVQADLLVIGTHDHTRLERLLLGSVAETLMRKATCSVLVVRPPA